MNARPDASLPGLADAAQTRPDVPLPPDLSLVTPDVPPTTPDLPPDRQDALPSDTRGPTDLPTIFDGAGDAGRSYERPDVFTHEVRTPEVAEEIDGGAGAVETATVPRVVEYPLPRPDCSPQDIAAGPDGNLWFTEACDRIGRITPGGIMTEFSLPGSNRLPTRITAGPDGNLWFVETSADRIGRISPTGVITEFLVPTVDSYLQDITVGPDGKLWFVETMGNQIGSMTTTGQVAEFVVPPENVWPEQIAAGSDGNLWFTTSGVALGRITTAGAITPVFLPFNLGSPISPVGIVTGPDGNLWIGLWHSDTGVTSLARVGIDGSAQEFPLAGVDNGLQEIVVGPGANLWVTLADNRVARFTLTGELTTFATTQLYTYPQGLTVGPDGNIWFTATSGNLIGQIVL